MHDLVAADASAAVHSRPVQARRDGLMQREQPVLSLDPLGEKPLRFLVRHERSFS
jgi:hypothetical protein